PSCPTRRSSALRPGVAPHRGGGGGRRRGRRSVGPAGPGGGGGHRAPPAPVPGAGGARSVDLGSRRRERMVRFIVVGRRTWRLTLTVAILLGLGSWAFLGDLTRASWRGEGTRAAGGGGRAWVAGRWPGGPGPAPALPATVPAAAPVTEARPSGAGPGEVGPGEAGSGGVTRSVAEE